jgi:hypothetical protein
MTGCMRGWKTPIRQLMQVHPMQNQPDVVFCPRLVQTQFNGLSRRIFGTTVIAFTIAFVNVLETFYRE